MQTRRLTGLILFVAFAAFAALPQMAEAKTAAKIIPFGSESKNSLCINPTGFPSPGTEGAPNFAPLEASFSRSGPFPDESTTACGALGTPVTEGGTVGGPSGFKYGANPLYGASVAGGIWESPYAKAKDTANPPPKYYIYDVEFNLPCYTRSETEFGQNVTGKMLADNAAAVYLNGKWLAHDTLATTTANFTTPTAFSDSKAADFKLGINVLQFIVTDTTTSYTGLDFGGKVTYKPCKFPRWGPNIGTEKKQTISWGKLFFQTAFGPATCKKSDAGNIWNEEHGPGLDETVLFDLYECSAGECPKGLEVTASGLPWHSELEESGGVIRDKTTGMSLTFNCEGRVFTYSGELSPKVVNATKKTTAYEEFGEGSGELESTAGLAPLTIMGNDYMAGFEKLEEITTSVETVGQTKEEKATEKGIAKEEKLVETRNTKEHSKLEQEATEREAKEKEEG